MSSVEFIDNSDEVKAAMRSAVLRGLEMCGLAAEKYAKKLCPVDTGNLRNSISHTVDTEEPAAYIGTNSEYAPYVEFGTGIYATGGRPTPWAYQDAKGTNKKTGNAVIGVPLLASSAIMEATCFFRIMPLENLLLVRYKQKALQT